MKFTEGSSLLDIKQILWKSARMLLYLTLLNVALSFIFELCFSGNISIMSLKDYLGNLALVEASIFFLVGGATGFIHSKLHQVKKLSSHNWAMKATDFRKSSKTSKFSEGCDAEWTMKEYRESERKALFYLIVGMFLCLELVFLALIFDVM
jgi:hypothetical protein